MLQKPILLLIVICQLICFSCSKDKETVKEISIDNTAVLDFIDLSDKIDSISLIPLNETAGNFIGDVFKVLEPNGKIAIFDQIQAKKVNIFDHSGTFIKTAIKPGLGPNEALQLNDCWLDSEGNLEVYDYALKKIYQFDSLFNVKNIIRGDKNHIFKSIQRIPNSDKYVSYATFNEYNPPYEGEYYHIALLDNKMNVEKTDLFFDESLLNIQWPSLRQHFYLFNDSIRFIQANDNVVYDLTSNGVKKKFKVVYKKNSLPDDVINTVVMPNLEKFRDKNLPPYEMAEYFKDYTTMMEPLLETDKYIFLTSRQGYDFLFFSLINKKTGKVEYNAKTFGETVKYKIQFPRFNLHDQKRNAFISVIPGSELKKRLHADSKFHKLINSDPSQLYVLKVEFKK